MKKRSFSRILRIIVLTAVCMILFVLAVNLYMIGSASSKIHDERDFSDTYDCILIFGAGVRNDGSPSLMLRDRLDCGLRLYQNGTAKKIIVSGDHGRVDYDEVNTMKRYLIEKGVPSEDIFMDHAGFSTYESIYRAKEIFGCEKIVEVTQMYHLYRALFLGQALGLSCDGVPADRVLYRGETIRQAREALARVKDFFSAVFKPEPTYLGDSIPIMGSGDVTNDR